MRALVTGASGFVGKALVSQLKLQGFQVSATSRHIHSTNADSNYTVGDQDKNTDWKEALTSCDIVFHVAARVHVMRDEASDPLFEFLKVNLHGTINLATTAATLGIKRFIYVSSAKVNGEYTNVGATFTEADAPQPKDAYAISKWQAERALHETSQRTGMEVVIVRPPLVYGPSVKANFATLLKLVNIGAPLPLKSVQNSRSLVYLGNLVDALIQCATYPTAVGKTYLVSDGEAVSTPQLVHAVAEALDRPDRLFSFPVDLLRGAAKLVGKSAAIDRLTQSLVIDSSKIRKELDWQPPYSMAQGLQATADWYRQASRPLKA